MKSEMDVRVVNVTPQIAANWLTKNCVNRTLRARKVEQYAQDMLAGKWRLSHQGIAMNGSSLLDGQHRLKAIIQTGLTIPMLVCFHVSKEAVVTMDNGLGRSARDVAHFMGIDNASNRSCAIAQRMINGTRGMVCVSRTSLLEFHARHQDAISFAMEQFPTTIRGLTQAPFLAAVSRAFYHVDKGRLIHFCDVMKSGVYEDKDDDSAALILRNWFLVTVNNYGGTAGAVVYKKSQRAIKAFCDRAAITKLYAAEDDLFPLPM